MRTLGYWTDPDLGNASDDYVGTDTTLDMIYVYNGDNEDEGSDGYGTAPPALGISFLQGPLVDAPGQTWTDPDGTTYPNRRRLGMSNSLHYFSCDRSQRKPARQQYGLVQLPARHLAGRQPNSRLRRRIRAEQSGIVSLHRKPEADALHVAGRSGHRRVLERAEHRRSGNPQLRQATAVFR